MSPLAITKGEKNDILSKLKSLEEIEEDGELSEMQLSERATTMRELQEIAKQEEISWRQKSKLLWLKAGIKTLNSSTRLQMPIEGTTRLKSPKSTGLSWRTREQSMGRSMNFYKNLYKENENRRPAFEPNCPKISEEDKVWLQRPFSKEEMENIIKSCKDEKAPGPDGFSMAFYKHCWSLVKDDVMASVNLFHQTGKSERSFNF